MHYHISRGGKVAFTSSLLKALANEKYEDFSRKKVKVGISTGDFDRRDENLGRNDIIVATSEKVDSLIRNRAHWIPQITLLVVDEVHLIDEPRRGPTLEMVITKLRARSDNLQIIALSATIGNPSVLAGWLGAELVTGSWRPIDLRQGVYYNGKISFGREIRKVPPVSRNEDINLLLDTASEGGQCLVFVSSRKNAEAYAKRAAAALKCSDPSLEEYAARLKKGVADRQRRSPRLLCRIGCGIPPCRAVPGVADHRGGGVQEGPHQVHRLNPNARCGAEPPCPARYREGFPPLRGWAGDGTDTHP